RKSGQADLEAEERMIRKAIEDKEKEKQQILDLYRKQLITSADVEEQLLKIAREKEALQKQAVELARKIEIEKQVEQQFNNAEELLTDLRSKLEKSPSFEDRRQIVKTLVREIRVKTETDEKGKLQADITVNFTFSHVVNCTDRDSLNRPA
ncbi:MAG: recombinase family protein, partial [Planifilum fulgidum]